MIRRMLKAIRRLGRLPRRPTPEVALSSPVARAQVVFTAQDQRYAAYQIGEWTYGTPRVLSYGAPSTLVIGKFCSIANGTTILIGGEHRVDWTTTYPFNMLFPDAESFKGHPHTKGDVIIGNDVWIGEDSFILSGVSIGNGAVIGARSVVTKDVAPYSIVAGNPAKLLRFRFPQATIDALDHIAWWDWPMPQIREAWALLLSSDIEAFISRYHHEHELS